MAQPFKKSPDVVYQVPFVWCGAMDDGKDAASRRWNSRQTEGANTG